MDISYHRLFWKHYKKLTPAIQRKIAATTELFTQNPFDSRLRNHQLHGKATERRAFSVNEGIRVVYETKDKHITVLFIDVGTHDQVY